MKVRKVIGFTGTRKGMCDLQKLYLRFLIRQLDPVEFHHGDCIGADAEAHEIVMSFNVGRLEAHKTKIHIHPPVNNKSRAFCGVDNALKYCTVHKSEKYLKRNRSIVDASDILVAMPNQQKEILRSGTWATVRYAKKKKVELYVILPDGIPVFTEGLSDEG